MSTLPKVSGHSSLLGSLDAIGEVRWVDGKAVMNVACWAPDPDLAVGASGAALGIDLYSNHS